MAPVAVFLLSLFIIIILPLQNQCTPDHDPLDPEQRQALLDFIRNVPHSPNLTWDSSQPACDWKGVDCDDSNKTVLWLKLPAKSFLGQIPPNTLGKLTSLRILSLRVNGFHGAIPPDFSNLTSLTRLSLNNNSFSGQLPDIDAHELTKFDVSFNKLNTSIPYSFSKFTLSAFSPNVFLCGPPSTNICPDYYPSPYLIKHHEKPSKQNHEIIAVSVASGLVLLILLCCVRKKIYEKQTKQPLLKDHIPNKLRFFDERVDSFDLEDLLKASAEVLGTGSVGTSYKQVIEGKNATVVVKRLKDVVVTENEFRETMEVLGKMKNNKYVVTLMAYYCSKDEKWLVYEYVPDGSLSNRLHGSIASGRTPLDWDHRRRIALSAARGLEHLHVVEKVVHGNIKSSNILLHEETNNEASLSDYGLNKLFVENQEVTFKSDVYNFGILLLELLTGQTPKKDSLRKKGVNFSKWVESIVSKEPNVEIFDVEIRMDDNMDEMVQLLRIAKDCVSTVPDQRPTMHDVVNMMHIWLRQSSDEHSKGYDDTPSTDTRDTPSTITP